MARSDAPRRSVHVEDHRTRRRQRRENATSVYESGRAVSRNAISAARLPQYRRKVVHCPNPVLSNFTNWHDRHVHKTCLDRRRVRRCPLHVGRRPKSSTTLLEKSGKAPVRHTPLPEFTHQRATYETVGTKDTNHSYGNLHSRLTFSTPTLRLLCIELRARPTLACFWTSRRRSARPTRRRHLPRQVVVGDSA